MSRLWAIWTGLVGGVTGQLVVMPFFEEGPGRWVVGTLLGLVITLVAFAVVLYLKEERQP